ncbi:MAG: hypothetical protein ACRYE8_00810 [Janthinobacterium lividum]
MVLISTVLPIVSTCFSNNRILSILVSVEALKLSVCKIDYPADGSNLHLQVEKL